MRYAILLALRVGCSPLHAPSTRVPNECYELDQAYLAWHSVGIASGGLAGATGTSGILTSTLADERGADISLAAISAVSGIMSAIAAFLADKYAERAVRCYDNYERGPP